VYDTLRATRIAQDILCPRCWVSKSTASNIGGLDRSVHCDACNIDFLSDFDHRMDSNTVAICIELLNVSSIAVTLNGRLDYYGASVNLAA
jgi:hypothetical protein